MSVSALDTYEKKEKWLLKPTNMAYSTSFFGGTMGATMWIAGVDTAQVLTIAIGSNLISASLLLWGMRRTLNAARGRY